MFERCTEKARRVIFFARYEASIFGSPYIESEHLLLGLLREGRQPLKRYLDTQAAEAEVREALLPTAPAQPASTSVDLPLSNEGKRILGYAQEEAGRLAHR
jgi:ATP-dependent Clp protease ATP-binding subunit ClpC